MNQNLRIASVTIQVNTATRELKDLVTVSEGHDMTLLDLANALQAAHNPSALNGEVPTSTTITLVYDAPKHEETTWPVDAPGGSL